MFEWQFELAGYLDRADILRQGVNLAAQLKALAEPGGICVSATVRDPYRRWTRRAVREQNLKNIARAVRVYRVRLGDAGRDRRIGATGSAPDWNAAIHFGVSV